MARIFHTGFEWRNLATEVNVSGTPTVNTTNPRSGSASMECSGSMAADSGHDVSYDFTAATKIFARQYMYIDDLTDTAGDQSVVAFMDFYSGGTNVFSIQFYNTGGTISGIVYYNDFANSIAASFSVPFDTWFRLEAMYDSTPANGAEVLEVRINGSTVASVTTANFTTKTVSSMDLGIFNGSAASVSTTKVLFDDVAINDATGSYNNSWCGDGKIVVAVPNAAGDNAATAGTFSCINEIPPTTTTTSGSTMVELDSNGNICDYGVTDSSTLGIDSYDTITAVSVLAYIREEAAGTSSYQLRCKSASGGTVSTTTAADAGNATPRTNPNGTTALGRPFVLNTDPTTGVPWTPTGTNSIDNMQIGVINVDADSTPDLWILAMAAMIEYVDGVAPGPTTNKGSTLMMMGV